MTIVKCQQKSYIIYTKSANYLLSIFLVNRPIKSAGWRLNNWVIVLGFIALVDHYTECLECYRQFASGLIVTHTYRGCTVGIGFNGFTKYTETNIN